MAPTIAGRASILLLAAFGMTAVVSTPASAHDCDLFRPTGTGPYVSVNPVLGLITVYPNCAIHGVEHSKEAAEDAAMDLTVGLRYLICQETNVCV